MDRRQRRVRDQRRDARAALDRFSSRTAHDVRAALERSSRLTVVVVHTRDRRPRFMRIRRGRGARRVGALAGTLVAGKDLSNVAGYPTSAASVRVAMSGIKTSTEPSVQRLLDAGARFAARPSPRVSVLNDGQNAHLGSPVNGAPDRISGGSSSGSASAVSHGLVDVALGSDTGGSVRAPANHCGLVGLRPTHGRVSLQWAHDLAPSFDTCGWFTRDVPTFARVADVLLGTDPSPLPERVRLLAPSDVWALLSREVSRPARAAARIEPRSARRAVEVVLDSFGRDWSFRHRWVAMLAHRRRAIDRFQPPLGSAWRTLAGRAA